MRDIETHTETLRDMERNGKGVRLGEAERQNLKTIPTPTDEGRYTTLADVVKG